MVLVVWILVLPALLRSFAVAESTPCFCADGEPGLLGDNFECNKDGVNCDIASAAESPDTCFCLDGSIGQVSAGGCFKRGADCMTEMATTKPTSTPSPTLAPSTVAMTTAEPAPTAPLVPLVQAPTPAPSVSTMPMAPATTQAAMAPTATLPKSALPTWEVPASEVMPTQSNQATASPAAAEATSTAAAAAAAARPLPTVAAPSANFALATTTASKTPAAAPVPAATMAHLPTFGGTTAAAGQQVASGGAASSGLLPVYQEQNTMVGSSETAGSSSSGAHLDANNFSPCFVNSSGQIYWVSFADIGRRRLSSDTQLVKHLKTGNCDGCADKCDDLYDGGNSYDLSSIHSGSDFDCLMIVEAEAAAGEAKGASWPLVLQVSVAVLLCLLCLAALFVALMACRGKPRKTRSYPYQRGPFEDRQYNQDPYGQNPYGQQWPQEQQGVYPGYPNYQQNPYQNAQPGLLR
mmetsp:Transcript_40106/g.87599  ORF Transcript_40106/g.87599 Transcript_40106/m.87599 type:complete len:464 (-) Transcript_40106:165-1556(-)